MPVDFFGRNIKLGDQVAIVKRNMLMEATVIDFTRKQVRVAYDSAKYRWAVGYSYTWGVKKGQTPTLLVNSNQIVKKSVDTSVDLV
jgi:hypothetical protein